MDEVSGFSDTNFVLRTTPGSNRVDTVAALAYTKPERNADGSSVITDFTDVDAWAALSDGSVLVVRGADYRIEMYQPDGTMDSVGVIPHRRVLLTEREAELVRDSRGR